MQAEKDAKIQWLEGILRSCGLDIENNGNEVQVNLSSTGFADCLVDFYVLKNNPEQMRVRMKRKQRPEAGEGIEIEKIQSVLQKALAGSATLERFHYYGFRKDLHIYYAHIALAKEPPRVVRRLKVATKALASLEGVDSKTFRKALDDLGLPRSSLIRLALTRIFRDSPDPEELLSAVTREAGILFNSNDWKIVKDLKEETRESFLSPIVLLLWEEISKRYMIRVWEDLKK